MRRMYIVLFFLSMVFQQTNATLSVEFVGDTTKIWDTNFSWYCCAVLFPVINISQDTIYITERDTLDVCDCICTYTICISLAGLTEGTYTAIVTREWKYRSIDSKEDGGSITFTKKNIPQVLNSVSFYQSKCLGNSSDEVNEIKGNDYRASIINYPNPFNPRTIIHYIIPYTTLVRMSIYNDLGKEVATVVNEVKQAGVYENNFYGNNLPTGVYFCRLIYDDKILISKFILLK
jgi:hypothetical protein